MLLFFKKVVIALPFRHASIQKLFQFAYYLILLFVLELFKPIVVDGVCLDRASLRSQTRRQLVIL